MRLFTAIEIPGSVKEQLRRLIEQLRPTAKLSWTRADNLHITTKFIGEWPEERLEEIRRAIQGVGSSGAIDISIRGIGWFPNARHPRVLWAGVVASERLRLLARTTDAAVSSIGVPKEEREYSPHLTLARIRENVGLNGLRKAIDSLGSTDFGSFRATAFHLYLSAAGTYTKLAQFELNSEPGI